MFNIFLNDLFFVLKDTDFCKFADYTLPDTCDISFAELLMLLECNSVLAVFWFEINDMKLNTSKCQQIISGNERENLWGGIGNDRI